MPCFERIRRKWGVKGYKVGTVNREGVRERYSLTCLRLDVRVFMYLQNFVYACAYVDSDSQTQIDSVYLHAELLTSAKHVEDSKRSDR